MANQLINSVSLFPKNFGVNLYQKKVTCKRPVRFLRVLGKEGEHNSDEAPETREIIPGQENQTISDPIPTTTAEQVPTTTAEQVPTSLLEQWNEFLSLVEPPDVEVEGLDGIATLSFGDQNLEDKKLDDFQNADPFKAPSPSSKKRDYLDSVVEYQKNETKQVLMIRERLVSSRSPRPPVATPGLFSARGTNLRFSGGFNPFFFARKIKRILTRAARITNQPEGDVNIVPPVLTTNIETIPLDLTVLSPPEVGVDMTLFNAQFPNFFGFLIGALAKAMELMSFDTLKGMQITGLFFQILVSIWALVQIPIILINMGITIVNFINEIKSLPPTLPLSFTPPLSPVEHSALFNFTAVNHAIWLLMPGNATLTPPTISFEEMEIYQEFLKTLENPGTSASACEIPHYFQWLAQIKMDKERALNQEKVEKRDLHLKRWNEIQASVLNRIFSVLNVLNDPMEIDPLESFLSEWESESEEESESKKENDDLALKEALKRSRRDF